MALVAFEMARLLRLQGQDVSHLIMIDPTSVVPTHRILSSRYYASRVLYHLSHMARSGPRSWLDYCRERWRTIRRRLSISVLELTNRPDRVDTLSRMEKAIRTYTPGEYPGRVTLFVASERVKVSPEDTSFGWSAVAAGGVDVHVIPGDHMSILLEVNMPILVEELKDLLGGCAELRQSDLIR
jgi:thioesterase domain-containing protein